MPQRGDNPNEVLYEDNTPFGYRVTNYCDFEQLICRSPEDILANIEEHHGCPLAHMQYREERISRWHAYWRKEAEEARKRGQPEPHVVIPYATREQLHYCSDEAAPKPHQHYLKQQPQHCKPTLTREQLIAIDTERDRINEFLFHEREYA